MGLFDFFRRRKPSEADAVREQLDLARNRLELAAVHQQESLLAESYRNNTPPWDGPFTGYPYLWHLPTDAYLGGTGLLPAGPEAWSAAWLDAARSLSRDLVRYNSFAAGAIGLLTDFLVGDGNKYKASTKDDASDDLVAAVQDVIDEFIDRTIWPEWEQELGGRRHRRDGEYFLRYFVEGGYLDMRVIEPEWVSDPDKEKQPEGVPEGEWNLGILFDSKDKQIPLGYWVTYPGEGGEFVPAAEVQHVKANVDRNCPRGLPDFVSTSEAVQGVEKLLRNMRQGEAVRAAIAGFWEYEDATASQVAAHVAEIKNSVQPRGNTPNPVTGKTENWTQYGPGTIIHTPKGKRFAPPPSSPASTQQVQVVQACLRSIAARWRMTEYMLSADSSNSNYASTLVSGSPFARMIRAGQAFLKRRFLEVLWYALRVAADAGRIKGHTWAQVESLIEIQCESHAPEIANELEQAQVDQIDMTAGVLSKQTRRMRRGLDSEQEQLNLSEEPPTPAPAPSGTGGGSGSQLPSAAGPVAAIGNPYKVERRGEKWVVVKIAYGSVIGTHETREDAFKQFAALEANVKESMEELEQQVYEQACAIFRRMLPRLPNQASQAAAPPQTRG